MEFSKVRNSIQHNVDYVLSSFIKIAYIYDTETAESKIYNIFNSFLFPYHFITNRTNKHTNKQTDTHTTIEF